MAKPSDPTAALMQTVADDPEVRHRVVQLALRVLDEADNIIEYATPAIKLQMVRAVMPSLVKALTARQDTSALEDMRTEMQQMFKEMRTPQVAVPLADPIPLPEDKPE